MKKKHHYTLSDLAHKRESDIKHVERVNTRKEDIAIATIKRANAKLKSTPYYLGSKQKQKQLRAEGNTIPLWCFK